MECMPLHNAVQVAAADGPIFFADHDKSCHSQARYICQNCYLYDNSPSYFTATPRLVSTVAYLSYLFYLSIYFTIDYL